MTSLFSKNYYQILGLENDCTAQDIKKSYHQLALIWHPDKHDDKGQAEARFTSVNEAYTVLSDNNKRNLYDLQLKSDAELEKQMKEFSTHKDVSVFKKIDFKNLNPTAVNIFTNIIEDKEDNIQFNDSDFSALPKDFKSTLRSFINQEVISSDDELVFSEYQPTFLNKSFLTQFGKVKNIYHDKKNSAKLIATVIADIPAFGDEVPLKKRRKSSIIIIEKSEKAKPSAIVIEKIEHQSFPKKQSFTLKLKNTLKRPFLYDEEKEIPEELPQKKVKRPQIRSKENYFSASSDEDEQFDLNLNSVLKGMSNDREPITKHLSLKALRKRLASQNSAVHNLW